MVPEAPPHAYGRPMSGNVNEFGITHLRHVDLAVPDFETQRTFYKDTWGLTEQGKDGNLSYFAAEGSPEQYVVRLRQAEEKRLDLISFGADSAASVDALAAQARLRGRAAGQPARATCRPPAAATASGSSTATVAPSRSPATSRPGSTAPSRRASRSRCGSRTRWSTRNDPSATRDWYAAHLGFKLSDSLWSEHMGEMMHFMRCNDWHHSFAIARGPFTSVHHVSFEMRGLDEYMRGTGRVMRAGIKKVWGPGRHLAGNNTFSYFLDPSGNTMEYTTELEKLETDEWHPTLYDIADPATQDQWGTADPMSEIIAKESFNAPDKGVFVAPPV